MMKVMMKMNNNAEDIRPINLSAAIYGSYTKKERLAKLVYDTYSDSSIQNATELNIFVDINSVIHSLYSENNRIQYNNITDLSSGIINLCAHYRSYFRTIYVNTKFFLINSLNICDINRKIVPEYNGAFYAKTQITKTSKLIENNMSLIKILAPYLPGIYYIESPQNFEASVIIADLIERFGTNIPNLIISRDLYPLQLTALYPYTSYLRPKYSFKDDISWMLPINEKFCFREQFWNTISQERRFVQNSKLLSISPVNFALFLALTKVPERNLAGITNASKAADFILELVGTENIKVNSSQFLNNEKLVASYQVALIDARYKVLDVEYMLPFYRNSPESKSIEFLDLEDAPTVNRISAKYYANNPLSLDKL